MGYIKQKRRAFATVFCFGGLLFLMTGCSTIQNLFSRLPGWSQEVRERALSGTETERHLIRVRPFEDPDHYYKKACFFQQRRKHRIAIKAFTRVVMIDPTHVKAYNGLAISYDLLGDFRNARTAYKEALKIDPNADYVLNNLGYSYILQGDFDSAIENFEKALKLHPENVRYHNNLGLAYAKKGLHDMAIAEFRKTGDQATANFNLAKIVKEEGDFQESKRHPVQSPVPDTLSLAENQVRVSESLDEDEDSFYDTVTDGRTYQTLEAEEEGPFVRKKIPTPPVYSQGEVNEEKWERIEVIALGVKTHPEPILQEIEDLPRPLFLGSISSPVMETDPSTPGSPFSVTRLSPEAVDPPETVTHMEGTLHDSEIEMQCSERYQETVSHPRESFKIISPLTSDEAPGNDQTLPGLIPDDSQIHEGIAVEILSFNCLSYLTQKLVNDLLAKGFKVECVDQATQSKISETRVHYCLGYLQDAFIVAKAVPGWQNMDRFKKFSRSDIKVRIILGLDLLSSNVNRFRERGKTPKS
ncbi:MAG: tetratricopeptide repeat protein [Desulfobacteraceae bacterium]|nr:MAG: tetratricopeptide repeat protein [Desulfobacteraceae bacterium]